MNSFHLHDFFFGLFYEVLKIYIFCDVCSGLSLVTNICISVGCEDCFGGGEPSKSAGIRSLVGLACCTTSCGMIRFVGRLGDFGDRCSGVGGSISIKISVANETVARFGIGRNNGGVCLFGISTVSTLLNFFEPLF